MRRFLIMFLLLPLAACAQQQEPAPTETLSVRARLVAFDAVIRDSHGEPVHHLKRDDFTLLVDGKPQPIRYFTEDDDLPLTIGLMVDTSGSQRNYFAEQKVASATFLRNMLTEPHDEAFVVRFDSLVLLLQRMTHDVSLLTAGLSKLDGYVPAATAPTVGTALFDSLCAVALNGFTLKAPGAEPAADSRRAVVLLTDGEDNGSRKTRDDGIACAQRAGYTVYAALYSTRGEMEDARFDPKIVTYPHEHLPGRTNLERIARSTGGRVFLVSRQPIESIYAEIQAELRSQYRLGFTPPDATAGSYHTMELKPKDRHLKVQARIGYYAPAQQ